MIRHEGGVELHEAIDIVSIGGPVSELVSEIGDVLYIYLRRVERYPKVKLPGDVRGHVNYALELCQDLNINPNHAVLMKVLRNDLKYPQMAANNGYSYGLTVQLSKMIYKGITNGDGDKRFYDVYEQIGEYWTPIVTGKLSLKPHD